MTRLRRGILAAGIATAACAMAWQLTATSRASPSNQETRTHSPKANAAPNGAPARSTRALSAVAEGQTRDEPVTVKPEPSVPREPSPERSAPEPDKPTPLSLEEALTRAGEHEDLTDRWNSEKRSSDWTAEARGKIQDLLGQASLNIDAVMSIDCRETICHFDLYGTDGTNALALIRAARRIHDETWVNHTEREDGTWRVDVFFSKEGYRLSGGGGPIEAEPVEVREQNP